MAPREQLAKALRHLLDAVGNYVEGDGDPAKLKASCDRARQALRPSSDRLRGGPTRDPGWRTDPQDA